jgi:hypothetical protein
LFKFTSNSLCLGYAHKADKTEQSKDLDQHKTASLNQIANSEHQKEKDHKSAGTSSYTSSVDAYGNVEKGKSVEHVHDHH